MNCCNFCNFQHLSASELVSHTIRTHKNGPQFVISCVVCGWSYSNYESYRKHVQRGHKELNDNNLLSITEAESQINHCNDDNAIIDTNQERLDKQSLAYLFQLKGVHRVNQETLHYVVSQSHDIIKRTVSIVKERLCAQITEPEIISNIISGFNIDPFIGLDSPWLQQKAFCTKLNLIELVEVKLGD